jgi:F0F1-type ATP synthase assembly protein I
MEYASTLLVTIGLGLFIGQWITTNFNVSSLWTVILAIVGLFMGIAIMAKRLSTPKKANEPDETSD